MANSEDNGSGTPAPVALVFEAPPAPTPGPVRLVFGGDSDTPAPAVPDATLHGGGRVTGLRLHVQLHTGAQLQGGGHGRPLGRRRRSRRARSMCVAALMRTWLPSNDHQLRR